jgi:TonB family protein
LELNKDAIDTLGFSFPGSATISGPLSSGGTSSWTSLFKVVPVGLTQFSLIIDALAQEGKVKILSRPHLACQSGKEAELLVGGEKPIFTTQAVYGSGTASEVEYKEYGIKLKIKPTVTEDKRIKLALNVEISEIGAADTIGSATTTTAKAYPLTKRNVSTELYLDDGQTMSIGGLIKNKIEEDIRKTPGLGDVPMLGFFFKKKTTKTGGGAGERGDAELFITLTPKIVGAQQKIKEAVRLVEVKPRPTPPVYIEVASTPTVDYAKLIQKRILDNLVYPKVAKDAGFQGTVKLNLKLSYEGKLLGATVKESSGYKLLDDNAVSAAKEVSIYPPFPSSIELKELQVEVPISYRLD